MMKKRPHLLMTKRRSRTSGFAVPLLYGIIHIGLYIIQSNISRNNGRHTALLTDALAMFCNAAPRLPSYPTVTALPAMAALFAQPWGITPSFHSILKYSYRHIIQFSPHYVKWVRKRKICLFKK